MEHGVSLFSAVSGLVFVLGLIFLISWLFKRFGGHMLTGTLNMKRKPEIELLDIKTIDPKNRLILARCRGKDYLFVTGETNLVLDTYAAPALPVQEDSNEKI